MKLRARKFTSRKCKKPLTFYPLLGIMIVLGTKENMVMKTSLKVVSLVLVSAMLMTAVSCGKNAKEKEPKLSGKIISEEDPWFDYEIRNVKIGTDPDQKIENIGTQVAGVDDKYIVMYTTGNYMAPAWDELDWDTYDFSDTYIAVLTVIDKDTKNVVNSVNVYDLVSKNNHVESPVYFDGKISLKVAGYNMETRKNITKVIEIDPLTGKIIDTHEEEGSFGYMNVSKIIGEYRVECVTVYSDDGYTSYEILKIISADGSIESIDMREVDRDLAVSDIFPLSDTMVLIHDSFRPVKYELDLKTAKIKKAGADDYEWLDGIESYDYVTGTDGLIYAGSSNGFSRIDIKEKKVEEVFNYNWSTLNREKTSWHSMVECTGDSIILAGSADLWSRYGENQSDEISIVELKRADKNPHAGKTVLELYDDSGWSGEAVEEAISIFNESDSGYFIKTSTRYSSYDYVDFSVDLGNPDEAQKMLIKAHDGLSNELAMDIINGDGPDILINTSAYAQLNNPNYLVDLSPYFRTLDPDEYYTNVIEGAMTDNALYQMPVSFSINGIVTRNEYAGSTGAGFTLSEYEEFLRGPLNGEDIFNVTRPVLFAELFSAMSDRFIKNGKADLSGPEFAELAEFVKDNFDDTVITMDEMNGDPNSVYDPVAYLHQVGGFGGYLQEKGVFYPDCSILGIPSVDGRGPLIQTDCSVAISAQAVDTGACVEFAKILLSYDIQKSIAMNDTFVLNRKALRDASEIAIDFYNNGGAESSNGNGVSTINGKFTTEDIDNAEKVIMSCSRIDSEDAAISMILIEEMPAYFLDQKDLGKVIKVAENRIQKVLDERGGGS